MLFISGEYIALTWKKLPIEDFPSHKIIHFYFLTNVESYPIVSTSPKIRGTSVSRLTSFFVQNFAIARIFEKKLEFDISGEPL